MGLLFCLYLLSCKKKEASNPNIVSEPKKVNIPKEKEIVETKDTTVLKPIHKTENPPKTWIELTIKHGFLLDIKYATKDNFTKKQIYDCGRCYLRPEAAYALIKVNQSLQKNYGYKIRLFDCFRPKPYQQRLWDIFPNANYVMPPHKGSMHSRGLAVDLTLVDANGKDLDMGTPFDFFGKEAHHDFKNHSQTVQQNRTLLKKVMEENGFDPIRTEWWHYSYTSKSYPLDAWVWPCN